MTEAIKAVEEESSNELELLITFRRAPSDVYKKRLATKKSGRWPRRIVFT